MFSDPESWGWNIRWENDEDEMVSTKDRYEKWIPLEKEKRGYMTYEKLSIEKINATLNKIESINDSNYDPEIYIELMTTLINFMKAMRFAVDWSTDSIRGHWYLRDNSLLYKKIDMLLHKKQPIVGIIHKKWIPYQREYKYNTMIHRYTQQIISVGMWADSRDSDDDSDNKNKENANDDKKIGENNSKKKGGCKMWTVDERPNTLKIYKSIVNKHMLELFNDIKRMYGGLRFQRRCKKMVQYMEDIRGVLGYGDNAHLFLLDNYELYKDIHNYLMILRPLRSRRDELRYHTYWKIDDWYYPECRYNYNTGVETPPSSTDSSSSSDQDSSNKKPEKNFAGYGSSEGIRKKNKEGINDNHSEVGSENNRNDTEIDDSMENSIRENEENDDIRKENSGEKKLHNNNNNVNERSDRETGSGEKNGMLDDESSDRDMKIDVKTSNEQNSKLVTSKYGCVRGSDRYDDIKRSKRWNCQMCHGFCPYPH